jgi:hypothetical protein
MLRWIVLAHLLSELMISPYLAHIYITSQTFTVSNLPGGFMSGLIRSCITCVTRTGKTLLNGPTLHGRNIRHIFFEPKVLCSCRWRGIMQCIMLNQYSGLFTCIMNYLHVLCMIFMVLSYVLCMTLIVFIYVYYELFTCTNLVNIMSLFSRFFRSIYRFLTKIGRFPAQTARKLPRRFSEKSADLAVFPVSLFIHRLRCVPAEFS